jgi:hydroxymethylpyrimidine pyrophosphatase-like HAD family hydrolase
MARQFLAELAVADASHTVAYCGDSPNDAPMFGAFDLSIGVANVEPFLATIEHPPAYITQGEGGAGFAEFVDLLLNAV